VKQVLFDCGLIALLLTEGLRAAAHAMPSTARLFVAAGASILPASQLSNVVALKT
jgi:hypothetical protein